MPSGNLALEEHNKIQRDNTTKFNIVVIDLFCNSQTSLCQEKLSPRNRRTDLPVFLQRCACRLDLDLKNPNSSRTPTYSNKIQLNCGLIINCGLNLSFETMQMESTSLRSVRIKFAYFRYALFSSDEGFTGFSIKTAAKVMVSKSISQRMVSTLQEIAMQFERQLFCQ